MPMIRKKLRTLAGERGTTSPPYTPPQMDTYKTNSISPEQVDILPLSISIDYSSLHLLSFPSLVSLFYPTFCSPFHRSLPLLINQLLMNNFRFY